MKKLILLMILALSLVYLTIPAWGAGHISGDGIYEDPAPPKLADVVYEDPEPRK